MGREILNNCYYFQSEFEKNEHHFKAKYPTLEDFLTKLHRINYKDEKVDKQEKKLFAHLMEVKNLEMQANMQGVRLPDLTTLVEECSHDDIPAFSELYKYQL